MRFWLICLFVIAGSPAFAQLVVKPRVYGIEDSTEVLKILEQGEEYLADPKTEVISAQYFGDAYRLARYIGFYRGEGEALRFLAILSVKQRIQYSYEAIEYFKKSVEVWKYNNDTYELAYTYSYMGDVFADKWNLLQEGLGYYKQALVLTQRLKKTVATHQILAKMVKLCLRMLDMAQAESYSKPLLKYYQEQNAHEAIAALKLSIAERWAELENHTKAKEISLEAQQKFESATGEDAKKHFALQLQSIQYHQTHKAGGHISMDKLIVIISTLVVIAMIGIVSVFYARRQVRKMQS
jgi:tetratricopeptide (TPR) repeat protein